MMKKYLVMLIALVVIAFSASGAMAATINLFDWAFNVDGATYEAANGDSMPTSGVLVGGLGTLTWSTSTAASHSIIAFFDHEIDEELNTFYNEYGDTTGTPAAGQSWEIDEPGYVFGDIYNNVLAGSLDNFNGVPSSLPDDVSMALGWDFSLLSGETAAIEFILSDTAPLSGFYLAHIDPNSQAAIYFSSNLDIRGGGPTPVPEPGTLILLGSGMAGLLFFGKKRLLNK
ncbi:MAG: PEP-CTERM sorting domain-containing protein [Nitrospirae bacterium]|nr:PEP-CTERM sorting domain-containing protein [Nitrospirota bacterium]